MQFTGVNVWIQYHIWIRIIFVHQKNNKKTDSNQTYIKYDKILTIKKVDIDEEISLGN